VLRSDESRCVELAQPGAGLFGHQYRYEIADGSVVELSGDVGNEIVNEFGIDRTIGPSDERFGDKLQVRVQRWCIHVWHANSASRTGAIVVGHIVPSPEKREKPQD